MDADDFVTTLREDNRTALSRLGSSKALYALTEGEMEPAAVERAVATLATGASDQFGAWDGELFSEAARAATEHREAVAPDAEPADTFALTDALGEPDTEAERLGAFVGWTLVAETLTDQCTGFFTGQADPMTASTFREYSGTIDALRERALDRLADVDDRDAAAAAATAVIQAAYDEYVETLEALGVNPKPVC